MKSLTKVAVWTGQLLVLVPPAYYWLDQIDFDLAAVGALELFPLLGMWAFSIMWYHFLVVVIRSWLPSAMDYKFYFRSSGYVVLALILLHPGLLYLAGTAANPRFTALDYVGEQGLVYLALGVAAWVVFMIYEVVERLRKVAFLKRHWQIVVAVNRTAFILVYIHGLQLGQHLQAGYLRVLWLFYGLSTAVFFAYLYLRQLREWKHRRQHP